MYTSNKCLKVVNVSDAYLWHYRLDYMNKNRIDRLNTERILDIDDCKSLSICESCLLSKMTKSSFKEKSEQATDVLNLIHSDICGLMSTSAKDGYNYFFTFTDDLSRYGYVYLMKHKSKSFEMFKRFYSEVER